MTEQLREIKLNPKRFKRKGNLSYLSLASLVFTFASSLYRRTPSLFSREIENAPSSFLLFPLSDNLVEMLLPSPQNTQNSRSICQSYLVQALTPIESMLVLKMIFYFTYQTCMMNITISSPRPVFFFSWPHS